MYHPTRGGVRGGRDQFKWDDVKVDKHRENYLGHSIMAPVGRWQKGKDLHWYTRDNRSQRDIDDARKEEVKRIKEEEDRAIQEALGLAPKRSGKSHGNRLDKHEFQELIKRSSTAEDLGGGHAEAAKVQGLGFAREPRGWEESSSLPSNLPEKVIPSPVSEKKKEVKSDDSDDESKQRKRRREEKEEVKHERQRRKHEKRHSRDSDDRKKHRHDKEKRRRHD